MSRSNKSKKSPGLEYWGRRPIGNGCDSKNNRTKDKRHGIQRERAILKREVINLFLDCLFIGEKYESTYSMKEAFEFLKKKFKIDD